MNNKHSKRQLYATTALVGALACAAVPAAQPAHAQESLETVVVLGVRGAEQKAVAVKRDALSISDSIAAEDIGKLPDSTISDSLQRITGVQINREGGEGTSINIRGLPQVGTLLNGEAFMTTASIVSVQPDFGDIPSQLFHGADVVKSPTATLLNSGITGTINLKTWRPSDLEEGWTFTAAAQIDHGTKSDKYKPDANLLVGYNAGKWGVLVSGSYSDPTLEASVDGAGQYPGAIFGETTDSTLGSAGFLGSFMNYPIPSGMTLLHPADCTRVDGLYGSGSAATPNGCDVDVNGDGKASSSFYGSEDFYALQRRIEKRRMGFNLSAQAELGAGFRATGDFFFTEQKSFNHQIGYQIYSATWQGASFIPQVTRDTGLKLFNGANVDDGVAAQNEFYTTQVYKYYFGDIESWSETDVTHSTSRNINLQLDYDNGGELTGSVRVLFGRAKELFMMSNMNIAESDGALWPNDPADALPSGYMAFPGGARQFDPMGLPAVTYPATVDMRGDHMAVTMPSMVTDTLNNINAWSLKTYVSEFNYDRNASMTVVRGDAHYRVGNTGLRFDFGFRQGNRATDNQVFSLIAPVYGSDGAYHNVVDPTTGLETSATVANPAGCYVHYKAADVVMNGSGIAGACKAGDQTTGYYRANRYAGPITQTPDIIKNNIRKYSDIAGIKGISVYDLDPKAMDNVWKFQNALDPGNIKDPEPGQSWKVDIKQSSAYFQANYDGTLVFPISANAGLKIINTDLEIDQHTVGLANPYLLASQDLGTTHHSRHFYDYLPAVNVGIDVLDNLKVRAAYSKNMQLLNLDQWGGALTINYAIVAGSNPPLFGAYSGTQAGNPDLEPWRSSNYDLSIEWYINESSMVSLAAFYVDVDSFIYSSTYIRNDIADADGVVRNTAVPISYQAQGAGKSLRGLEIGYRQALDFLPGFWKNFGVEANFTYSPSSTGHDVAGHSIPFQDNSRMQSNLILWYQDDAFQARVAANYRSRRAVSQDYGGISGFEEYQRSTLYVDASATYTISPNWEVYIDGSNLTGEGEHYYLVWTDQRLDNYKFEPRYSVGVRAHF